MATMGVAISLFITRKDPHNFTDRMKNLRKDIFSSKCSCNDLDKLNFSFGDRIRSPNYPEVA